MAVAAPLPVASATSWRVLAAFGAPAAAYSFYLFFIQFFFLKFATDVLLAAPAVMGLLFGLGRLWDAVSDPLVGYWSDRTRTRAGRRRPWMFVAVPLLAVFFVMVWTPPAGLSGGALVAWSAVGLLGFYTAYTLFSIPHLSLGAELTEDHHGRSRVFGAQRGAFVLGMLLPFVAIDYVTNAADPRQAARSVAFGSVLFASLLLLVTPLLLRERPEYQGRVGGSPWQALRDVTRNAHARVLLGAWFVEALGAGVLGVLAPFVTQYVVKRPDLIGVVPAFYVVPGVLSIPVWIALSRRFGKRDVWRAAVGAGGIFFGLTFFVGENQVPLLCALLVGAGLAGGCGGVIGASMLADVIDYDEYRTGERKEGAYAASWGFVLKGAIGATIAATGVALQLSGFEPNAEQSRTAELTLRGLFAGAPFLGALGAVVILRGFRLDAAEHARIRKELDARAATAR